MSQNLPKDYMENLDQSNNPTIGILPVEGRQFLVDAPDTDGEFPIIDKEANILAWTVPDNTEESDAERVYRVYLTAELPSVLEVVRRAANGEDVGFLARKILERIDVTIDESVSEDSDSV